MSRQKEQLKTTVKSYQNALGYVLLYRAENRDMSNRSYRGGSRVLVKWLTLQCGWIAEGVGGRCKHICTVTRSSSTILKICLKFSMVYKVVHSKWYRPVHETVRSTKTSDLQRWLYDGNMNITQNYPLRPKYSVPDNNVQHIPPIYEYGHF